MVRSGFIKPVAEKSSLTSFLNKKHLLIIIFLFDNIFDDCPYEMLRAIFKKLINGRET